MSNFTMGTILEKDFAQAQVPKAKPFPKIVPMVKLDIYTAIPQTTSLTLSRRRIHSIKLKYFEKAKIS